jgi:hypothetical protein
MPAGPCPSNNVGDLEIIMGIRPRSLTSIGDLLPAVFAAWKPRNRMRPVDVPTRQPPAEAPCAVWPNAAALPSGVIAVAQETRTALAAVTDLARNSSVELQMAVDHDLVAQVDAGEFRTCLRELLSGAIGRAQSGVLVTAMRQADSVEIAVVDDGAAPAGTRRGGAPQPAGLSSGEPTVPQGGTLTTHYQPDHGTTNLLRLPWADHDGSTGPAAA